MAEETEATQAHDEMEKEQKELDKQMKELEENPPEKLEDWPDGKAKYRTFGGPEAEAGYDDGATAKLGPSEVRHFDDGRVEVSGEEVDNPEDFKGEPIPGGPTDPNAPDDPGMVRNKAEENTDDGGDSSDGEE
jgi:hypothetical protein